MKKFCYILIAVLLCTYAGDAFAEEENFSRRAFAKETTNVKSEEDEMGKARNSEEAVERKVQATDPKVAPKSPAKNGSKKEAGMAFLTFLCGALSASLQGWAFLTILTTTMTGGGFILLSLLFTGIAVALFGEYQDRNYKKMKVLAYAGLILTLFPLFLIVLFLLLLFL